MGIEKLTMEEMRDKTIKNLPQKVLDDCREQISRITNPSTDYYDRKMAQKVFSRTIVKLSNKGYYTEYLSNLYEKYVKQYGDW